VDVVEGGFERAGYQSNFTRYQCRTGINVAGDLTHTFTPLLVAEGRFGYHRYDDHEAGWFCQQRQIWNPSSAFLGSGGIAPASPTPNWGVPPGGEIRRIGFFRIRAPILRPSYAEIYNDSFFYDGLVFIHAGGHANENGRQPDSHNRVFPRQSPTGSWSYNGFFTVCLC